MKNATGSWQSETPLRALPSELRDGCHRLSDPSISYRDGGETRVLELLVGAKDLSSTSDELLAHAESWPEQYHLNPARAHVLRPLRFKTSSVVLEIGCGCGAISRFLAEQCGLVDSLEPMQERARCARERTRDLANVEVFVGTLDDVPLVEAYDAVVILGVLEYVGGGSAASASYLDFLRQAAARLRPGGTLVLGIENRLGVKYLCGAPEDHSGRPFESVEGYDQSSPARTFSRRQLESFMRDSGLSSTTLGLFPDYKLTRLVFADSLLEHKPELAAQIPHFPSPDWTGGGPRAANEARVWSNLIESGLGGDTANSLLMLGHRGLGPSPLWPDEQLAVYYPSAGRRMVYVPETSVMRQTHGIGISRRRLIESAPEGAVRLVIHSDTLSEGDDLLWLMARTSSDEDLAALLNGWVAALDRALHEGTDLAMDLLPHNAIMTRGGTVEFVDSKWDAPGFGRHELLGRAAFVTAWRLALLTSPNRWPVVTVEALALHIGAFLGLDSGSGWLASTLDREALFQAEIAVANPEDRNLDDRIRRMRSELEGQLARPLANLASAPQLEPAPLVRRLHAELNRANRLIAAAEVRAAAGLERADNAEEQTRTLQAVAVTMEDQARTREAQLSALQTEMDALHRTRTLRYTRVPRTIYGHLRRLLS